MGLDGYINFDSGPRNMTWGMKMPDVPERAGFTVTEPEIIMNMGLV